jgi:integrase
MPIRKDAAGYWHAEVCVGRKRLHRRLQKGESASDARKLEAELTLALERNRAERAPAVVPGNPTLLELLGDYTTRHAKTLRSEDTALHHANRIGPWCEGKRASDARTVAGSFIQDATGSYAPATINRSLGTLKKALADAFARGQTDKDYSALVKRLPENNQRTTYLSMEEVKAIADLASQRTRVASWVSLLTGCRRGEVCKIQAKDIGEDVIRVPAGNTKTLRYREVPIVPALRPWLEHLPLGITFEGVKSGFQRARRKAGREEVNFHDLRHSCASILLAVGVDLYTISKILGHSSAKTTERYSHLQVEQQRAALEKAFG